MPFNVSTTARRQALPKPEILKIPLETNVIESGVILATGITADVSGPYAGRRYLLAGTILSKRGDGRYERYVGTGSVSAVNEVQTLTISATGGTFTLTFNGEQTAAIAWNAASSAVQSALVNLPSVQSGDVTVTGSAGGPYTITFGGNLGGQNVSTITTGAGSLTGGSGTATIVVTTPGSESEDGTQTIDGILFDTVEFADNSTASNEPVAFLRRNVSFDKLKIVDYDDHEDALAESLPTCEFI